MPTKKSLLAGVFCLGLSVITFEIALTRVFAIMMWHHFTYMVISIGLLGFGASGSLLTATRMGQKEGSAQRLLVWTSLAYAASVVLAFCFATLVNIDSLDMWRAKKNFIALFFVYLIIFVPFLFGGLGIGLVLTRFVQQVNRLYFADLVGSALGAGISVLLLQQFGSSVTVVAAGGAGALAAFCFSLGLPRRYLVLTVPGLLVAALTMLMFLGGSWRLGIPAADWNVPFAPNKEARFAEIKYQRDKFEGKLGDQSPEFDRLPSATAEVEVGPDVLGAPMIGGDMGMVDAMGIRARSVGQDGGAPTMLYAGAADLSKFPFLDDTQAASAYVVHQAAGRKDQQTMVIGVGGGVDVLVALANGAAHVTAVELNTAMIDMVTDRYADYLGGLFVKGKSPLADRIDLVNSEGRAWLRSHDTKYDVIQMSGVDSYTALSSGAYTLSESYLYTIEAVQDFYSHLRPDGIVCYSRFIELPPKQSRETLRLANIACQGLAAAGVADPASHVCVLQGRQWASTMIKQSPFTAEEIAALRAFATKQAFVGLIFDPLRRPGSAYVPEPTHFALLEPLVRDSIGGTVATLPERDDGIRAFLAVAAEVAKGKAPDAAMLPEAMRAQPVGAAVLELAKAPPMQAAIVAQRDYFARTTADFLRLLRADAAGQQAFYAEYAFDVSPATDDSPFFFNYWRWSSVFGGPGARDTSLSNYHNDLPIGHLVLLGSMLQIVLLAALLIFLPIRKLAADGLRTPGAVRYLLYFGALGLGFMLIEIALMQKLVIFLGHPTYALSVVLTSLLAAAGVGSLTTGRFANVGRKHVWLILLAIIAVVAADVYVINEVLPDLLGQPLWQRVLIVVAMLLPTGFVLGMPFPTGMRIVEGSCPQLVPWGWAINAFFSVFGSIFCIVLSMAVGFSYVFYVAIGVYVVGLVGMKASARPAPDERDPADVVSLPPIE
ncbi:MAG: hypothetical protein JNN13_02010 [Planctomycetes bacterium]|nr:hypothetical protein [Planctomycetota bacterium]